MSPFTLNQYLCPDHPRTQLFEDEYVAIAAATNTLIGDTLSAEQYFSLGHVAVRFADAQNPAFEEWFVRAALKPRRVEVVTPLFGNVPLFLVGTNRLATVHRRLAEHFAKIYPIRILPVPFDIPRVRQMAGARRSARSSRPPVSARQQHAAHRRRDGDRHGSRWDVAVRGDVAAGASSSRRRAGTVLTPPLPYYSVFVIEKRAERGSSG